MYFRSKNSLGTPIGSTAGGVTPEAPSPGLAKPVIVIPEIGTWAASSGFVTSGATAEVIPGTVAPRRPIAGVAKGVVTVAATLPKTPQHYSLIETDSS